MPRRNPPKNRDLQLKKAIDSNFKRFVKASKQYEKCNKTHEKRLARYHSREVTLKSGVLRKKSVKK